MRWISAIWAQGPLEAERAAVIDLLQYYSHHKTPPHFNKYAKCRTYWGTRRAETKGAWGCSTFELIAVMTSISSTPRVLHQLLVILRRPFGAR